MALRTIAARTRSSALRLPSPAARFSPPAAARPFNVVPAGRPRYYWRKDAKTIYEENLELLEGVKKHERSMRRSIRFLEGANKGLSWSFKYLMPIPLAAAVLKVTH
ncbi:hypothetical protein ZWY2020_047529 [Hordeum vulgare]|nr:hypothetical protein ZWY2020_047529 [Hordeum vulgare]